MNKNEVLEKIKNSGIDLKEAKLGNSAALVLYEVIGECRDIDLQVSSKEFERLIKYTDYDIHPRYNHRYISNFCEGLDIFEDHEFDNKEYNTVLGIKCFKLRDIRKEYLKMGRDKDLIKVQLIEQVL